jgi:hypothetical protein
VWKHQRRRRKNTQENQQEEDKKNDCGTIMGENTDRRIGRRKGNTIKEDKTKTGNARTT